jgi:MFS transporter, SHS family, sialic acid transporter
VLFGWLGDKIGRVKAMTLSVLVYAGSSGLCAAAGSPLQLAVLRFVGALGMGGEWALGVALVMETWPEKHRPWLAGAIGAAANLGFLLVAAVGRMFPVTPDSWRFMLLIGASPALLVFLIRLFVPESERWRAAVKTSPEIPVREIFAGPMRRATLVAIAMASVALIGTWAAVQWIPLWVDQMARGADPGAKATAQMAYGVGATLGSFIGPIVGGRLSRRAFYCVLCLVSFAACAWQFRVLDTWNATFVVGIVVTGAATASFYGFLPLYLPELFPTRARATGQGTAFNLGRVFAAGGSLVSGQLVAAQGGSYAKAAATVTLIYLIGAVIVWFAPETRGKPLPD